MMRLDGKVTLITGVSQYMGPAFTRTFTDAGAIVVTQDRTRADAEPHAEYAARNGGGRQLIAKQRRIRVIIGCCRALPGICTPSGPERLFAGLDVVGRPKIISRYRIVNR
jgi:NAD(P)-dependent dehydrogenase (short-subunit alcohol dehydrogenase family)